jgi:S1-C subfamily serine protease
MHAAPNRFFARLVGLALAGLVGKLLARLDDYKVGDTVKLTVLRGGARSEVAVTLQPGA